MKFTKYLNVLICTLLFSYGCGSKKSESARIDLNMNTDWAFYRGDLQGAQDPAIDDSAWIPAVIPHIMQLEEKHNGGDNIYKGVGWYRRHFTVDSTYSNKKVFISFEGVMTSCNVFINGKEIDSHYGGYVGFTVDATDLINWGKDNVLAVRVSAEYDPLTPPGKPQGRLDFYYYSGIYRDVNMTISDKFHITDPLLEDKVAGGGVFVTYPEVTKESAKINVKVHVKNSYNEAINGTLATQIIDSDGKFVSETSLPINLESGKDAHISQDIMVTNPKLWHPYTPNRYKLKNKLVIDGKIVDEVSTMIGIRTIKQTTNGGFFINGEHLYLIGANRHQAYANVGDAASNSMQERDVIDFKRGGFNSVRAAHYPQDPAFLDACDKYGLLVLECIPGWQYFNADSIFVNRLYDVNKKMIRRDRNHPSIFLWETALNESRYPISLAKDLYDIAHAEYPGDQMYTSGDYFGHADMVDYYDVFYKQVSKFPKDGDVMSNYPEDLIAVKPLYTREWGDGVGEKPRVALSENEMEHLRQCRGRYDQLIGNGYFDWCMLDANERMGGHFLWSYNDYTRGSTPETMFCGIVDVNRYPKFSYYMMQSMRDKNIDQEGLYKGPMVFIASKNSSADLPSSTSEITIFSNCDKVKLYRNDKLIGEQTREQCTPKYAPIVKKGGSPCFIFDAGGYEAGKLHAEGIVDNKVVAEYTVRTPEAADHIKVIIYENSVEPTADGSDMIPVYFKICDKNGTRVDSSDALIKISVSGEGTLIGEGIDRIAIENQKVEGGVGFAFIRTTKNSGKITISATSENLKEGKASIMSIPFNGKFVDNVTNTKFTGNEEDNVITEKVVDLTEQVARKPIIEIEKVEVTGSHEKYPATNLTDGSDKSWWIAADESLPQVVTVVLKNKSKVFASRLLFQKDSASYRHKVETSTDGKTWQPFYERECTGWEFKPMPMDREIKYMRITIDKVSEGRAGMGEITLYGE